MTNCRALVQTEDLLGEGPVYRQDEDSIYWTDIDGKCIQRWSFADQQLQQWDMPEKVGSFGFYGDNVLLAMETGFFRFDLETQSLEEHFHLPHGEGMRSNDGKSDALGRFWVGTMHISAEPSAGVFYRVDLDGSVTPMFNGIRCPNSLAWSLDSKTMYFADSMDKKIYAYPFDLQAGAIGERRVFADTSAYDGLPDGATVDADNYLWSAMCGGYSLIRYAPDGSVDRVVPLPVRYPTSCAFAGRPGKIYVTGGIFDLDEKAREASGFLDGALLEVDI